MKRPAQSSAIRILIIAIFTAFLAADMLVCAASDEEAVPICSSPEEAAVSLRDSMKERKESAAICLVTDTEASASETLISGIFELALEHTGDPREGDYLRFQYGSCDASARPVRAGGEEAVLITYSIRYYDTAEQELQVEEKAAEILRSLDLEDKTDEEKVRAIYDYICDSVAYDYDNLTDDYTLKRTAYAALVDGKAVCQGYSAALYRLLLEAGIDNRIVFGTGINESGESEDHTWNIVKIGDSFYNTDVTKDDELGTRECFLKGPGEFDDNHIRAEEYTSNGFISAYEIAESDYGKRSTGLFKHPGAFALNIKMLFQRLLDLC